MVLDDAKVQPATLREKLSESELCPDALLAGQEAAYDRDIERLKTRRAEFVNVTCPACAATAAKPAFEKRTFHYVVCQACGTLYMNPRPSPQVMADHYAQSENYRYWAEHIFPASEAARRDKIHRPWLDRVLEFCRRFEVPTGTLMEVGAGFGIFASLAQQSGAFDTVVAVEPTPDMAAACRKRGLRVLERRIEELEDPISPDVIVSFEVIEHLFDPRRFVKSCSERLRSGGLLVLSCPNAEGFDVSTLGPRSLAVEVDHVNLFNPRSLTHLVETHGFDLAEVSTPGRLDAEFVRRAALNKEIDLSTQPLLKRVLLDEWDRLGWPFQQFLASNGLSSHMWLAARRQ